MPKAKVRIDEAEKATTIRTTEERIIASAYQCFSNYGIAKTSMEDIAREAELSRPTVYKYFPNKSEIVNQISMLEALKLNNEVRRRCTRQNSVVDTIIEATLIAARVSSKNVYVRRVMESIFVPSISSDPAGPIHQINRGWWRRLIEEGVQHHELATDLTLDQIVSWLSLSQALLLVKLEAVRISDDELREFIRRFIVEPLLAGRGNVNVVAHMTPSPAEPGHSPKVKVSRAKPKTA
jgi:AcrR family transcriptional regulator